MRKQTTLLCMCVTCTCLLQLYSCIKPPHDFDPRDGNNVYNGCRVKQIINPADLEVNPYTWQFVYNSSNDPVSVSSNAAGSGRPNLVFKYDRKDRLIEYSGIYTNGDYEFVHRYGYSQNRIVTDTQYVFGTYGNLTNYQGKRYKYLSYDNLNRIVKDSEVFVFPGPMLNIRFFSYDANGNLINGKVYDNKLNLHRTNKIWMFIDRDYSVNNPDAATSYNSVGLPLTYNPGPYIFALTFAYVYYYGSTQITYDCK